MINVSNYDILKLNLSLLSGNLEKKEDIIINQEIPLKLNQNSFKIIK